MSSPSALTHNCKHLLTMSVEFFFLFVQVRCWNRPLTLSITYLFLKLCISTVYIILFTFVNLSSSLPALILSKEEIHRYQARILPVTSPCKICLLMLLTYSLSESACFDSSLQIATEVVIWDIFKKLSYDSEFGSSRSNRRPALKSSVFWDITSCIQLRVNRRFGRTCRVHLQGWKVSQGRNQHFLLGFFNPEDGGDIFPRNVSWL
jgi:hypothetical protein